MSGISYCYYYWATFCALFWLILFGAEVNILVLYFLLNELYSVTVLILRYIPFCIYGFLSIISRRKLLRPPGFILAIFLPQKLNLHYVGLTYTIIKIKKIVILIDAIYKDFLDSFIFILLII